MKRWGWIALTTACLLKAGMATSSERWWVFFDRPPEDSLRQAVERVGARVRRTSRWLAAYSVVADASTVERLRRLEGVRELRPVARFRRRWGAAFAPTPTGNDRLLAVRRMVQADRLQARGLSGKGVRVGVLDSGFRLDHRVFGEIRVVAAWDFVHDDPEVADQPGQDDPGEDDHGTQILGILAGFWPEEYQGLAPAAEYVLAKTEDVSRNGRLFESSVEEDDWVAGLEWCAAQGCEVVNSSLGYPLGHTFQELDGRTTVVSRAVAEAARRGVLVVTAAGNWDRQVPVESGLRGRITPPADAPDALTVGAVTAEGRWWSLSAVGPTADGRIKPDVAAPGVQVPAILPDTPEGFTAISGTSAATPVVAGVVVLLREAFPTVPIFQIAAALRETATQADAPDPRLGYGLIQAERAYDRLAAEYRPTVVDERALRQSRRWGSLKQEVLQEPSWGTSVGAGE